MVPSGSPTLTFTFPRSSARTASRFPALTASTSVSVLLLTVTTAIISTPASGSRRWVRMSGEELVHATVAVAERFHAAAVLVGNRQPQVADRRPFLHLDVAMPFAHAAADSNDWQRIARVRVGIAHAAAVEDQRVIEDGAI